MTELLTPSLTSSPHDERIGSQTPRVRNVPKFDRTLGGEVVNFMAEVGRPLDPWQADITMTAFALCDPAAARMRALWAAYELLILLSRQNGKGGATEAIELGGLFLFREPLIMHSAHQFRTTQAAFRRIIEIIDGSDWLTKRVQMISKSKGDESVLLTKKAGGGRLQFVSRTLGTGRGLTGSKNIFDEAWALTVAQYAAQTPALATIPNPQIIYTTTPPDDDIGPLPDDAMLPSVRKRAQDRGGRIALFEWSPPGEFDRTDRDVWYDCNPALGIRISEWFLAQQLAAFTAAGRPEKFDTEHLGLWLDEDDAASRVIPLTLWLSRTDEASQAVGRVGIGIDASPDLRSASIAMTGARADGKRHWQVLRHDAGTSWVVPHLVELRDSGLEFGPVGIDPGSPAGALISDVVAAGFEVEEISGRALVQAWGSFKKDVDDDQGRHIGQETLDQAIRDARNAPSGDVERFSRKKSSGDICPLVAVTLSDYAWQKGALVEPDIPLVAWR